MHNARSKPNSKPPAQFFSVSETAIILNVSRKLVYQWIKDGMLAAFRIGNNNRTTRISQAALERFIAENTIPVQNYDDPDPATQPDPTA